MNIQNLSDRELYSLCKKYGEQALCWRRKFIGLLPEVSRRKLYERHGFASIFEFAARLAGVSQEQVRLALNLEEKFSDKKVLHGLLVKGKVSISKLSKIASIATVDNEECLAEQAKVLSYRALETLVRDERMAGLRPELQSFLPETIERQIGLDVKNILNEPKSLRAQTLTRRNSSILNYTENPTSELQNQLLLSPEVQKRLWELQNRGIDINELLKEFLDRREKDIKEEKEKIAEKLAAKDKQSKHIPTMVERVIQREHGTKCSISICKRPAENLHHTLRFALYSSHDPHYIAPLCREHHLIAHSIDRQFTAIRREKLHMKNGIG